MRISCHDVSLSVLPWYISNQRGRNANDRVCLPRHPFTRFSVIYAFFGNEICPFIFIYLFVLSAQTNWIANCSTSNQIPFSANLEVFQPRDELSTATALEESMIIDRPFFSLMHCLLTASVASHKLINISPGEPYVSLSGRLGSSPATFCPLNLTRLISLHFLVYQSAVFPISQSRNGKSHIGPDSCQRAHKYPTRPKGLITVSLLVNLDAVAQI